MWVIFLTPNHNVISTFYAISVISTTFCLQFEFSIRLTPKSFIPIHDLAKTACLRLSDLRGYIIIKRKPYLNAKVNCQIEDKNEKSLLGYRVFDLCGRICLCVSKHS